MAGWSGVCSSYQGGDVGIVGVPNRLCMVFWARWSVAVGAGEWERERGRTVKLLGEHDVVDVAA